MGQHTSTTSYTNTMAALEDPYGWDRASFGIPAARARGMDPQQRRALTLAREAFQRAGRTTNRIAGRPIGTVIGISSNDYRLIASAPITSRMLADGSWGHSDPSLQQELEQVAARTLQRVGSYSISGVLGNVVSAVVQHYFDLCGPAFTVDSACSSSLTAIHLACTLIASGEIDECLAGGIYLALTPDALVGFSHAGALSPTGACSSFAADADGFTLGEGGALVLLKNLDRARKDGDRILAVIEGWGSSSDGRAPGIMTPNEAGQIRAIRNARHRLGYQPLDFVEGHGTGTVVGDAQEIRSLKAVDDEPEGGVIPLGSAKAVIGHTLAAAGALSTVKAVQMFNHQVIPAQPVMTAPANPELTQSRFHLASHRDRRRPLTRIGINSFGFGGSNSHLVLANSEGSTQ